MRIHNIDNLSALMDRLIIERIKYSSFEDAAQENGDKTLSLTNKMQHQLKVINEIKSKLDKLLKEVYEKKSYSYVHELRTTKGVLVDMIEKLIIGNLDNRSSERYRIKTLTNGKIDKDALMDALKTDLWLRLSSENRANAKNSIDKEFKKIVDK